MSSFADSYFSNGVKRWDKVGLPKCQLLAEQIYSEKGRKGYFNEAQLLKHALGVSNKLGNQATLIYLYYDLNITSEVGNMHKQEIHNFKDKIEGELNFDAITYQGVFQNLEKFDNSGAHSDYIKYLINRYFA